MQSSQSSSFVLFLVNLSDVYRDSIHCIRKFELRKVVLFKVLFDGPGSIQSSLRISLVTMTFAVDDAALCCVDDPVHWRGKVQRTSNGMLTVWNLDIPFQVRNVKKSVTVNKTKDPRRFEDLKLEVLL